jgi:hypothetical protein
MLGEPCEGFHVPRVIVLNVDGSLACENVERRQSQIVDGSDVPAVSPVRLRVLLDRILPRLVAAQQVGESVAADAFGRGC